VGRGRDEVEGQGVGFMEQASAAKNKKKAKKSKFCPMGNQTERGPQFPKGLTKNRENRLLF
jgi:hypothetical protein